MSIAITRYDQSCAEEWNRFVQTSKNGTFLLERGFMDYHADRFSDYSLIFREENNLLAVLPANLRDDTLYSHQGLTYGGLITQTAMTTERMKLIFASLLEYLRGQGVKTVYYKTIPHIYHRLPAEEDRFALFYHGAELCERQLLSVCLPESRPAFQERRTRGVKKAVAEGITVRASIDWSKYWGMLASNLDERYSSKPVHTLAEITQLQAKFPDSIKLFVAEKNSELLAGVVIFESDRVAHVQYIASTSIGRDSGAVDILFQELLRKIYSEKRFFDFGSSNVPGTRELNDGLVAQKEGFGARAVVQDHYRLSL